MATKQDIARDMKSSFKGQAFLNVSELSQYLGWNREKVRRVLKDVECFIDGKERRFFVNDVAKRLCESQTINTYGGQ